MNALSLVCISLVFATCVPAANAQSFLIDLKAEHDAARRVKKALDFADAAFASVAPIPSSWRSSQPASHVQHRSEDSCFFFSEFMLYSLRSAPTRGRFAVVTDVGCGMRWVLGSQHGFAVPTNDPWRTVKSRGPGLPMLRSSLWAWRRRSLRVMGARKPGPQGDRV